MKYTICFITILLNFLLDLHAGNKNDSLLKVLDKVISDRMVYTEKKAITLKELKLKKAQQKTLEKLYRLNTEIIHQYETFVCDSAEQYNLYHLLSAFLIPFSTLESNVLIIFITT